MTSFAHPPAERGVAIVTGAGTGIGRAAALALLHDGWRVVLAGRRPGPLDAVAALAPDATRVLAVPTDVGQEAVVQRFGRVDSLFDNAGISATSPIEDLSLERWQEVVDVNLTGMFLCLREAFRTMKDQHPRGGRIIDNGSISATTPRPHSIPYTATKHGVSGLTKTAALDGRVHDIAFGQIDVGNALTGLAERMERGML